MKKLKLSRRQQSILDYIRTQIQQRGIVPTIREIGEAVDLSSISTVHSHLRALEAKGYIRRDPSKPRSIQLVEQGPSRVEVLEALVREAQGWTAVGPVASVEQVEWLQRAATVVGAET